MSDRPIEDYALLSDCRTAALVDTHGAIDWLCWPRFDSPSVFAAILDGERGGSWCIRPTGGHAVDRGYLDATLVLQTTFRTDTGVAVVEDALAVGPNQGGHDLGAEAPGVLLRRVRGVEGRVEMEVEFAPRPEYGLIRPVLRQVEGGVLARGGAAVLRLSSPIELALAGGTARAHFVVEAGDSVGFALSFSSSSNPVPAACRGVAPGVALDESVEAWRRWSAVHQGYDGPWRDLVRHSGRVLQGLTYFPTGAIVAAPTTSLPETVGGSRNWDYRFTWVRDASFTLDALWVAACPDEAHKFFDFITNNALLQIRQGGELQIMFGVGGEHDLSERELPHLSGWRGSRPVRVGNGAWDQRQLDVYGELLDAAHRLEAYVARADPLTRSFLADLADAAAARWKQRDQGIWEVRGSPRHYLYSKLMCWVAVDRAIAMADLLGAEKKRVNFWRRTRAEIRATILERGWNEKIGSFTQAFDGEELDASNLMMPIVGFLSADHPRMRATIEATAERLTDGHGLVYRYRAPDGLEGEEGTFLLCTFWLAEAWALAGEVGRARDVFERAVGFCNDVGLLAEEVDPGTGALLGNFPQAFSHIGLVNAAWAISRAEEAGHSEAHCTPRE